MILLINDDGIHAPGLRALYKELREVCDVPVLAVAPLEEHSGQSHAITLDRGLSIQPVKEDDFFGFAIDGTPADCCKVALTVICQQSPRLVVSGINNGPNVGRSLFYSGTVGAALEAAVEGYPAIAISKDHAGQELGTESFTEAAGYVAPLVQQCLRRMTLRKHVLNINLPAQDRATWGPLVYCEHGRSGFKEAYRPTRQANKRITWQLHGTRIEYDDEPHSDAHALINGNPTLTCIQPNLNTTSHNLPVALLDNLRDCAENLRKEYSA